MCISNEAEYAVRIMQGLAYRWLLLGPSPTTRTLAARYGIPPRVASRVVALLRDERLISTARGAYGGIALECDPREVSVGDVLEAVRRPVRLRPCSWPASQCPKSDSCDLRELWIDAQEAVDGVLYLTRISDLAETEAAETKWSVYW
ncbi:MAG TPA: hypothetical protein DGR79_02465 [Clostridiales bacterium]|nr:hypothetical protein [Clostridiales bacterium]